MRAGLAHEPNLDQIFTIVYSFKHVVHAILFISKSAIWTRMKIDCHVD